MNPSMSIRQSRTILRIVTTSIIGTHMARTILLASLQRHGDADVA
jgi:hypothetical protein